MSDRILLAEVRPELEVGVEYLINARTGPTPGSSEFQLLRGTDADGGSQVGETFYYLNSGADFKTYWQPSETGRQTFGLAFRGEQIPVGVDLEIVDIRTNERVARFVGTPGREIVHRLTEQLPPPGSFGLSRIGGLLGKLIAAGQAFSGDGSRWTHAFIVLDDQTVIEAMPGGARIVPLADRLAHEEVFFSDRPIQSWMDRRDPRLVEAYGRNAGTHEQLIRQMVILNARRLEGTGYGYLQYVALGLVALGFKPEWLKRYVASKGRMICSQMCDEVYRRAGIQLFDDGRLPQEVTPGDLARYAGAV